MSLFDPTKVNWGIVEDSAGAILAEFAKGTGTPLDDLLAPFAKSLIHQFLQSLVGDHHAMFAAAPTSLVGELSSRGYGDQAAAVPAWLVALALQVGPVVLKALLDRFFPPK